MKLLTTRIPRKFIIPIAILLAGFLYYNWQQKQKTLALIRAIDIGDMEKVVAMVEGGANVNGIVKLKPYKGHITGQSIGTPLRWALVQGRDEIAEYLRGKGARLTSLRDPDGVFQAVFYGDVQELERIIWRSGNLGWKDIVSRTLLHYAAKYHHPEIIEVLVKNGADIHAQDHWGETPLHNAIEDFPETKDKKAYETLTVLVKNGSDIHAKDQSGKTPIDIAREKGYDDIVEFLEKSEETKEL